MLYKRLMASLADSLQPSTQLCSATQAETWGRKEKDKFSPEQFHRERLLPPQSEVESGLCSKMEGTG